MCEANALPLTPQQTACLQINNCGLLNRILNSVANIEKLKNSFKYADRKNYKWVMIIGEDEEQKDVVQLKNMETKEQLSLSINDAVKTISKK